MTAAKSKMGAEMGFCLEAAGYILVIAMGTGYAGWKTTIATGEITSTRNKTKTKD